MEYIVMAIKGGLAAIGGFIAYWLGGIDSLLTALLMAMALDYITGLLSAAHNKTLSSAIGFKGITKKVMLLIVVALAFIIEDFTGGTFALREIVIAFFFVNEALSILENAAETGLPIPDKVKNVLHQIRGKDGSNNE